MSSGLPIWVVFFRSIILKVCQQWRQLYQGSAHVAIPVRIWVINHGYSLLFNKAIFKSGSMIFQIALIYSKVFKFRIFEESSLAELQSLELRRYFQTRTACCTSLAPSLFCSLSSQSLRCIGYFNPLGEVYTCATWSCVVNTALIFAYSATLILEEHYPYCWRQSNIELLSISSYLLHP